MKNTNTKTLTRVALLVAIELVMKLVGLGSVPVGPLYMSFLTLPIAVGAITMGPAVGALLGGVFGAVSFYDAITGASAMTGALFQVSPLNTFILCVGMRVLMGLCCGLIFKALQKLDKSRTWSYILSAMTAPALNTLFFMGYIVLAFYGCDYVQNLVSVKGAANPFMFVVLLVGVQGVAEFLVSGILGGIVARAGEQHYGRQICAHAARGALKQRKTHRPRKVRIIRVIGDLIKPFAAGPRVYIRRVYLPQRVHLRTGSGGEQPLVRRGAQHEAAQLTEIDAGRHFLHALFAGVMAFAVKYHVEIALRHSVV